MIKRNILWLILAGMASFTTLTAMTVDCYTAWLNAFEAAYTTHDDDVQDCQDDHFVMGIFNGLGHCLWEADTTYDNALNAAVDAYEVCIGK